MTVLHNWFDLTDMGDNEGSSGGSRHPLIMFESFLYARWIEHNQTLGAGTRANSALTAPLGIGAMCAARLTQ